MERLVKIWTTLFALYLSFADCSLYFPMGDLEVEVPVPEDGNPGRPLASLRVLSSSGHRGLLANVNFTHARSRWLQISNDGTLRFTQAFYDQRNISDVTIIADSISARDTADNQAETTIRVALARQWDCDLLTTELCFWRSVKYQLYENRGPTAIGSLNSPYLADMCPGHRLNYTLLNGTSHLAIEPSTKDGKQWTLRSLKAFERDIWRETPGNRSFGVGDTAYLGVRCTVSSAGSSRELERALRIQVLDENDNAPSPQFPERELDVYVTDEASLKAKLANINHLIFIDRDSKDVNNYTVKIFNDYLNLFKVSFNPWADDRNGEHQTAIHFKLLPVNRTKIPEPFYSVVIQINDTSLLPGNGDSTANLTINFHTGSSSRVTSPVPANLRRNLLYPAKEEIFRSAAPLARVAQPTAPVSTDARFRIRNVTPRAAGAFNVTIIGGIVFVQNVSVLRKSPLVIELEIQWENKTTKQVFSDLISVTLKHETTPSCGNLSDAISEWKHCAEIRNQKQCTQTCGLATAGRSSGEQYKKNGIRKCMWRGERKPGYKLTDMYSTCTPDIDTCPDFTCDPLEKLHPLLCPQDCTTHPAFLGEFDKETKIGIAKGRGVCSCDKHAKCYCDSQDISKPAKAVTTDSTPATTTFPSTTTTNNLTAVPDVNASAQRADTSPCGTPCLIGIAAGSLFLLGAVTAVVACWRFSHNGKGNRRDRKYTESVNSINGAHSDYIDRTIPTTDTLLLNFDMNTSLTLGHIAPKIIPVVDPKWEFPRENLRIEQTLGEGEFGRVLRAKALEIAGLPGYTTVAVKTLKEDAREAELADLMSEYQLLKEVSHPNVIRLLGASTLPGGPVYLIIEFAEHGSLRNYLRRSRHLESEGRTPCSGALLGESEPSEQLTCKISPRDILSFAWQISKGMSYLNDMKLVHRDLAARNVLLATGMVCKISDFGLTRDVYEDDTYLKRTKGRVPVKWMAPESLADHIYNSKSDVWSFGILLWELVTLGASPYPGVAVQNLFHLLRTGYRMDRPDNCSPVLYKLMKICWSDEPGQRPSFRSLTLKLETMLADGIDYLDLNPRVVHNRTYFSSIPDTLITPDEVDDTAGYGNLTMMHPDTVLWKRPESPKATNTKTYENESTMKMQELNHYESPIKFRNKADGLQTPTNERPQSYIDMAGATNKETQTLLRSKSKDEIERVSKVTSL